MTVQLEQKAVESPEWLSCKSFQASTPLTDKVARIGNAVIFLAAGFGIFAAIGGSTLPVTVTYLSYAALALALRKIIGAVIVYCSCYHAIHLPKTELAEQERLSLQEINKDGFITNKILLIKSGTVYDAIIIGKKETLSNGRWVVHAFGSNTAMEKHIGSIPNRNMEKYQANTLFINAPAVGHSKGYPTRYQMGGGFEAGLQFLEQKVKASHIVPIGFSLGGGVIAEAVSQHTFDPNVRYLSIFDRTFSKLSDMSRAHTGIPATDYLSRLSGGELDCVAGVQRLAEHGIPHIIIQHCYQSEGDEPDDGTIPDAVSLASGLANRPKAEHRTVLLSATVDHHADIPKSIQDELDLRVKEFFNITQS